MIDQQLIEHAHLWGSDSKNYLLLNVDPEGTDLSRCMIIDRQNKSVILIENRELVLEVMRRMRDAGVEIVSKLPAD
jgi:hypothetical protein